MSLIRQRRSDPTGAASVQDCRLAPPEVRRVAARFTVAPPLAGFDVYEYDPEVRRNLYWASWHGGSWSGPSILVAYAIEGLGQGWYARFSDTPTSLTRWDTKNLLASSLGADGRWHWREGPIQHPVSPGRYGQPLTEDAARGVAARLGKALAFDDDQVVLNSLPPDEAVHTELSPN